VRATYSPKNKRNLAALQWPHVSLVVLVALALGLSACGGGAASLGVATARSNPTTTLSTGSSSPASSNTRGARSPKTTTAAALTGSSSPSGNDTAEALKFAQRMRSRGVGNYPDPPAAGSRPPAPTKVGMAYLSDSFNPNTPTFQAAERACQKYAVGLATRVATAGAAKVEAEQLRYAQCLRTHGVQNFPDPGANGGFTIPNSDDQNSSFFQAAERACRNLLPGLSGPPGS